MADVVPLLYALPLIMDSISFPTPPPPVHSWPVDAEMQGSTFSWLTVMVRGGLGLEASGAEWGHCELRI